MTFPGMKILFYIDRSVQSAQTQASSSFFTLFRSFVCKSFDTYLPTYLPIYVALRVLSLFSRKIPPGNKIACNIIPDSPVSPLASPFHPLPNSSEKRPSIPFLSTFSPSSLSMVDSMYFWRVPSTDNGPYFFFSSVFRGWWNIRQGSLRVEINVWKNYDAQWERVVFF